MAADASATDLQPEVRQSVEDLILVLADSKRILGLRYADWMLGAPELEAGIACAAMAQDEWGHARLLYALLKDFEADVERLEHGREPGEYRNIEVLDRPAADWPALVALNALVDTALSLQFEALRGSAYAPVRQRVEKLLEEERFHAAHGAAWLRRLAGGGEAAGEAMRAAARDVAPNVLRWFGPDSQRASGLVAAGVADAAGGALRRRYLERVRPLLDCVGLTGDLAADPDFGAFDEATRRASGGGPDEETVVRARGDRNRVFLMD